MIRRLTNPGGKLIERSQNDPVIVGRLARYNSLTVYSFKNGIEENVIFPSDSSYISCQVNYKWIVMNI